MAFKHIRMNMQKLHFLFKRNASFKSAPAKQIDFGGYALLSVPVTTFCLGTWQVKRRTWKLNLIEDVKKMNTASPVELPNQLEELHNMEYQRVSIRGTFDHSKEMYIGPRQLISGIDEGGGLMSSRSQSGYFVITPFCVIDKNITILVNRGWVPRNKLDPHQRAVGQVTGVIDLIGSVRLHERRPQFSPKSKADSNHFFYRDVLKMASMTGSAPVFIDADKSSTVPGGPIGGQTRITFRNEHLSYIITWYSLSAATFYMWYKKFIRPTKLLL